MTEIQKIALTTLLHNGDVSGNAKYGYRVRDVNHNPVLRISAGHFKKIKNVLRYKKNVWVLNKMAVRRMHGKAWLKQQYKLHKSQTPGR